MNDYHEPSVLIAVTSRLVVRLQAANTISITCPANDVFLGSDQPMIKHTGTHISIWMRPKSKRSTTRILTELRYVIAEKQYEQPLSAMASSHSMKPNTPEHVANNEGALNSSSIGMDTKDGQARARIRRHTTAQLYSYVLPERKDHTDEAMFEKLTKELKQMLTHLNPRSASFDEEVEVLAHRIKGASAYPEAIQFDRLVHRIREIGECDIPSKKARIARLVADFVPAQKAVHDGFHIKHTADSVKRIGCIWVGSLLVDDYPSLDTFHRGYDAVCSGFSEHMDLQGIHYRSWPSFATLTEFGIKITPCKEVFGNHDGSDYGMMLPFEKFSNWCRLPCKKVVAISVSAQAGRHLCIYLRVSKKAWRIVQRLHAAWSAYTDHPNTCFFPSVYMKESATFIARYVGSISLDTSVDADAAQTTHTALVSQFFVVLFVFGACPVLNSRVATDVTAHASLGHVPI